jgi:hypothetical protein
VASPGLGFKTRAIMLVLQEITIASRMMHEISSTPSVMDDTQMKSIDSRPSARM